MGEPASVPDNFIVLDFGDGEYTFALPVGQLAELQTKCDAGIGLIFQRLLAGRYRDNEGNIVLNALEAKFKYEDITETIRLGLIGGGTGFVDGKTVTVDPASALRLCRAYVFARPLLETWKIAAAVLSACVVGYANERAQKKSPEPQPETTEAEPAKDGSTSTAA